MSDKSLEENCIERIIQNTKHYRGKWKEIISILNGEEINRELQERPDFLKRCIINDEETVIGIEHFSVDQFSKMSKPNKKTNATKIQGTSINYIKEKQLEFNIHHNHLETDEDYNNAVETIAKLVSKSFERDIDVTYNSYIAAFKNSFNTHLQKVPVYKENIERLNLNCKNVKLCFLIEFFTDFKQLFYIHSKKIYSCKDRFIPLFEDIIEELEKLSSSGVEYLIMSFNSPYDHKTKTVAVETKHLRTELKKHHVRAFKYIGKDMFLSAFQSLQKDTKMTYEIHKNKNTPEQYEVDYTFSRKPILDEQVYQYNLICCCLAYFYRKANYDFVLDGESAMFLYVYGEYVAFFNQNKQNGYYFMPIFNERFDRNITEHKYKEFEKLYGDSEE